MCFIKKILKSWISDYTFFYPTKVQIKVEDKQLLKLTHNWFDYKNFFLLIQGNLTETNFKTDYTSYNSYNQLTEKYNFSNPAKLL